MISDEVNIGILKICKHTITLTDTGGKRKVPNENMKVIEGGIPAIIPADLFELAQRKLKTNKVDKSHLHRNPEDFLLKGHIVCQTCDRRMSGRYNSMSEHGKTRRYAVYACTNHRNKYDACPERPTIRTDKVDQLVWEDCCRVFERLDAIRDVIVETIRQSVATMLEDATGKRLVEETTQEIAFAKEERAKHAEGSYPWRLMTQDIADKE